MMDEADSLVQCPYNKSHILYQSRLQTHLVKCKWSATHPQQNVDPIVMQVCKFNSNHHIMPNEIDQHHKTCPDIGSLARFMNIEGESAVPYQQIDLPPTDENWDNDECTSTYDPEQHASSSVIIRSMQGVPKSVRRNFRMQERDRINRLRENQEALERSGCSTSREPQPQVNSAFSEDRLRIPRSDLLGMGRGRLNRSGQHPVQVEALGQGARPRVQPLQDIPSMMPSTSGRPRSSNSSGSASPSFNTRSSERSMEPKGNSSSDTLPDSSAEMLSALSLDDDGFTVQKSKKNKKKKEQTSPTNMVNGRGAGSSSAEPFPSLPGRGRGRLPLN